MGGFIVELCYSMGQKMFHNSQWEDIKEKPK